MAKRLEVNVVAALAAALILSGATPPESPVADAAMNGRTEEVRTLLQRGADVNAAQADGMTALHWAAEHRDAALARMLIAAGANVAAVTRLGDYAPLHIASKRGAADVIDVLVGAGARVDARTSAGGATPLHYAVSTGTVESVRSLLRHGAEVDARETMWQQTPLMFASAAGRTEVVNVLLDAGADASLTARVLDMAEREEQDDADQERQEQIQAQMRAALEGRPAARGGGGRGGQQEQGGGRGGRGGDQPAARAGEGRQGGQPGQAEPTRQQVQEQQRDRFQAGRLSHAQMVGGYGGMTPLLLAARDGHRATAKALLDRGAGVDQPSAGDGTTPLLMATINGHFDMAEELLARGADPTIASEAGATPLYTTLNTQWIPKARHPQPADYMQQETTYLELMRALLDAGADVNARLKMSLWFTTFGDDYLGTDRTGATAFWRAAYALDIPAMKLLLEYGADPNLPTIKSGEGRGGRGGGGADPSGLPPVPVGGPGSWAIHAASGIGYGEGYAANIHRVVPDAWVPAVKFLVEELGANVNARDSNGYNAVHHAAARGDNELIEYLVSKGADVMAVSRRGQTTVDMANGPVQRISPFPETIALLESLGAKNNHNCVSC